MKRGLDIGLSIVLLPFVVLLCLPAAVLIALESPGNPIFRQVRVGRNEVPFTVFKMRTMYRDTVQAGSHEVSATQLTRFGRLFRRLKIDELPQVFNVLLGQMSFVGPRPCLPVQVELIEERRKRSVFDHRPGITGPAQLAGVDMSTPERLAEIDARYVAERTLAMDLRLIVQTATGGGRGDAALAERN